MQAYVSNDLLERFSTQQVEETHTHTHTHTRTLRILLYCTRTLDIFLHQQPEYYDFTLYSLFTLTYFYFYLYFYLFYLLGTTVQYITYCPSCFCIYVDKNTVRFCTFYCTY